MLEGLECLTVGRAGALFRAFAQFDAAHLSAGVGGKIAHGQLGGGAELLIAQQRRALCRSLSSGHRLSTGHRGGAGRLDSR